ncbi:MAG: phosphatidate cytidylyltransferase [Clostridia bacterium]|nr:phosphatidate cytidylyltransferase [Clostridia bacterium]MBQ7339221.1 phosphatidate cytidylyltransferase [Clostridia bacterium]
MAIRVITAIVAIAILLPILIFSDTLILPVAAALLSLIAVYEMLKCCHLHRRLWISIPLMISAIYPLYGYFERDRADFAAVGMAMLVVWALYLFTYLVFMRGKISLQEVGIPFFACFYIIAAFSGIIMLRYSSEDGKYLYLICFIGAWVTDTFAYFAGRLFGKHKLIPEISPKKTVEGSIGGIIFCILAMLLYGFIVNTITDGAVKANYLMLAASGLFISFVSQIGDLAMSAVKRTYGLKDYGKLFPGHGGVLDRFDSVLAVALVLSVLSSLGNLFVMA